MVQVGGASLTFPSPKGMTLAPPSSALFAETDQWTVPSNRLLALYVAGRVEKDATLADPNRMAVQTFRQTEQATVSVDEFQAVRSQYRASNQALIANAAKQADSFHPAGPDVTALSKSIRVGEARGLETFNESNNWSISVLMLVKYTREVDGRVMEFPMVIGNTVFLLRGKIFFLYVYHPLESPDSLAKVKAQTLAWLAAAKTSNP